jgi:hypothetical protein
MATTYQILRTEITKDRSGNDEVFVDVQIYDDTVGIINYPIWYSGQQALAIIADNSVINTYITPILPALVMQKSIEITNTPVVPQ